MRVSVTGDSDCAKSLRGLLRKAGFAVSEWMAGDPTEGAPVFSPLFGYAVKIEEHRFNHIHFDSVDSELERHILKHVSELSTHPVMIDRPGGVVHSDREIRILVPAHLPEQQQAVELGVLRGLLDTLGGKLVPLPPQPTGWWLRLRSWWGGLWRMSLLLFIILPSGLGQQKKTVYQAQGQEAIQTEIQKTPEPPVLTAEQKFRIRDLQHHYDDLRLQMAKLELDKMKLERELSKALSDLNGIAYDLARESKVDTARYNLNIDSLLWEKRK